MYIIHRSVNQSNFKFNFYALQPQPAKNMFSSNFQTSAFNSKRSTTNQAKGGYKGRVGRSIRPVVVFTTCLIMKFLHRQVRIS